MSVDTENSSGDASPSLESMLASALAEADPVPADPSPETVSTAEETSAQVSTEEKASDESPPETLEPPPNLSAEQREEFAKLPPGLQRFITDRHRDMQSDYTRKTEEVAKERAKYQELESAFEPYREQLALSGTTPAQAARQLLAAQQVLTRNPAEGLKWLASSLNFDLRQLAPPPEKEEEFVSPEVAALRKEIAELRGQVTQTQVGAQQEKQAEALKFIKDFQDAKDEQGNPKHPHFDNPDVRAVIGTLVGRGKSLEDAYKAAIRTVPEVVDKIAQEAAAKAVADAEEKAKKAREEKLTKARTASQTIRSRGTAEERPVSKSIEDDLRAAMREVS